jgi:SAM-dependent methyltransferase
MNSIDYSIHYGKWASTDSRIPAWQARRYVRQSDRWLPKGEGARILEIGPGNGLTLLALLQAGYAVEGIEADRELAAQLVRNGLNVKWIPAEETPAYLVRCSGCYDLVYANNVLEHVPVDRQIDFVSSIATSLRPGGHFVCDTPNALAPLSNWHRYIDWTHTSIFTTYSLEFLLLSGGLEPIYVGAALDERMPPKGSMVGALVKKVCANLLLLLSRGIHRIHIGAELGAEGLRLPVTSALLAAARKP